MEKAEPPKISHFQQVFRSTPQLTVEDELDTPRPTKPSADWTFCQSTGEA
jgi:hypothetical protein